MLTDGRGAGLGRSFACTGGVVRSVAIDFDGLMRLPASDGAPGRVAADPLGVDGRFVVAATGGVVARGVVCSRVS